MIQRLRIFLVVSATEHLLQFVRLPSPDALLRFTTNHLLIGIKAPSLVGRDIQVASAPTLDWTLDVVGDHPQPPAPSELVISYSFGDPAAFHAFRDAALGHLRQPLDAENNMILEAGADPGGGIADHWCPGSADAAVFGDRADARRVLAVDGLRERGLGGRRVNVVIIDEGLDRAAIPSRNWGGGLRHGETAPGTAPRRSHGMLIARNVLDIAPDAILYDVPMIPPRISAVLPFASDAYNTYLLLRLWIGFLRKLPRWSGPWILTNAWAIFDRASELPLGDYTQNTHPQGHPFNNIVGDIVGRGLDIVFAAGNCGQFCPSRRCGPTDRGPGHSIWGANAHPAVITAGAVRCDEMWLGYSSQGPGPEGLAVQKPDLCAPSNFSETLDGAAQNTGTSAACGLTAGVVAALRSHPTWDAARVSPRLLKQRLIDSARQTPGPGWDRRLGYGVLDGGAAAAKLAADFP
jgi:subtilisin family serine protease